MMEKQKKDVKKTGKGLAIFIIIVIILILCLVCCTLFSTSTSSIHEDKKVPEIKTVTTTNTMNNTIIL